MSLLQRIGQRMLGYDAVESKGRRKVPNGVLRSEDSELLPHKRRKLIDSARDLNRNYSLVAWAIRKHLDYVSAFTLQVRTGNNALDDQLEKGMRIWGRAENCDISRRHPLRRLIRLLEARRTIDGDIGLMRLRTGNLQAIEGDRVRSPMGGIPRDLGIDLNRLIHGVYVDQYGAALKYAICRRNGGNDYIPGSGGFQFERLVNADHFWLHAYHDRIDQVRGISPLSSSLNTLRDTYEGFELALAKMKVGLLFGFVTTRKSLGDLGDITENVSIDGEGVERREYEVDFGKGPFHLDMDPGDDAKFLENKTPSIEFQQFSQSMIALALKSLDIPYSFFAENFTNYSGARQALLQYSQSAADKRADNRDLLDWITEWRIRLWLQDNELPGADPAKIRWEWIPTGLPWIDPLKEVQASIAAEQKGLTSPQRICRENGDDWYQIQDERAEAMAYMKSKGLTSTVTPVPLTINEVSSNG